MRTTPALLAAMFAATVFAAPAVARPSEGVNVKYTDLDLDTAAGQAQLERRIDKAAREVCGVGDIHTGTIMPSRASQECYAQTKATVHEQVAQAIARGNNRG